MEGSLGYKWLDMAGQLLHTEVVAVVVAVEDHVVAAEIVGALEHDPVPGHAVVTGIANVLTAVATVALDPTARAPEENHTLAANLLTGRKTVVPNLGTELIRKKFEKICQQT